MVEGLCLNNKNTGRIFMFERHYAAILKSVSYFLFCFWAFVFLIYGTIHSELGIISWWNLRVQYVEAKASYSEFLEAYERSKFELRAHLNEDTYFDMISTRALKEGYKFSGTEIVIVKDVH